MAFIDDEREQKTNEGDEEGTPGTGWDDVDIYSLPYGDYGTPRELRMATYPHVPGLEVVKSPKGRSVGVKCVNLNDFGAYMTERFRLKNANGSVTGWETHEDEDGNEVRRRISNENDIIDLITKVGFDVFDTDRRINDALRAVERSAKPVDAREAANFVGFANGTYDVRDDSWHPGADSNPTLYTIPHDYDPGRVVDRDGVMWRFLDTLSCGREDVRSLMCQVFGLCMVSCLSTRETPLLVSPGQHGKSTFLEVINAMMGEDLVSSKSVHELCNQFGLDSLRGKAVNVADDEDVSVLKTAQVRRLKIIGSHGTLFADRKCIKGVEFRTSQTLVIASNASPRTTIRDANNGLWDRLVLIPFDADFSNLSKTKRDPDMVAKVTSEDAILDAIALGIEAVPLMRDNGWRMTATGDSLERTLEMRMASDSVLAWVRDEVSIIMGTDYDDPKLLDGVFVCEAFLAYRNYCSRANCQACSMTAFSTHVRELNPHLNSYKVRWKMCGSASSTSQVFTSCPKGNPPSILYRMQFDCGPGVPQNAAPVGCFYFNRLSGDVRTPAPSE